MTTPAWLQALFNHRRLPRPVQRPAPRIPPRRGPQVRRHRTVRDRPAARPAQPDQGRGERVTTCQCGKSWAGKRLEHCTVCHETFSGTTAGDKHRIGAHDVIPSERRCLTPDEMRAKKMTQNARGVWTNGGVSPWAA